MPDNVRRRRGCSRAHASGACSLTKRRAWHARRRLVARRPRSSAPLRGALDPCRRAPRVAASAPRAAAALPCPCPAAAAAPADALCRCCIWPAPPSWTHARLSLSSPPPALAPASSQATPRRRRRHLRPVLVVSRSLSAPPVTRPSPRTHARLPRLPSRPALPRPSTPLCVSSFCCAASPLSCRTHSRCIPLATSSERA